LKPNGHCVSTGRRSHTEQRPVLVSGATPIGAWQTMINSGPYTCILFCAGRRGSRNLRRSQCREALWR
jgi:hypothetical protein